MAQYVVAPCYQRRRLSSFVCCFIAFLGIRHAHLQCHAFSSRNAVEVSFGGFRLGVVVANLLI